MSSEHTILHVEDDENDAFLTQRAFKQAEILNPIVNIQDGAEAIQYLAGERRYANRQAFPLPCLVLLDLNLPRCSGLEVLHWIRTGSSVSTLPVIILSASNQKSDIQGAYQRGANGYLIKPNKPAEMLAIAKAIKDFWLTENRSSESWEPFFENKTLFASGISVGK